jgi:predicted transcriptional regulator
MADGDLTLKLDDETARRLEAAAETAGRSVAELAAEFISSGLSDWDAADWAEVDRICDETIVRGDGVSIDELRPWLQAWGKDAPPSR